MGKKAQDDRIVVRIDSDIKIKFSKFCDEHSTNPSDYLRNFILDTINSGFNNTLKEPSDDYIINTLKSLSLQVNQIKEIKNEILKMKEMYSKKENKEDKIE